MLVCDRILLLRQRIKEQHQWINRCGGDLDGYIANYGDPDVPPIKDGKPQTFNIPDDQIETIAGYLTPVPDTTNEFFARHSGNGGTLIYGADYQQLCSLEQELREQYMQNPQARQRADEKTSVTDAMAECRVALVINLKPIVDVIMARYVQNGELHQADVEMAFKRAVRELLY